MHDAGLAYSLLKKSHAPVDVRKQDERPRPDQTLNTAAVSGYSRKSSNRGNGAAPVENTVKARDDPATSDEIQKHAEDCAGAVCCNINE